MKKLAIRFFFLLLLLSAHGSAADEETTKFCIEWHGITKILVPARITSFQEKGYSDESAEIFSRFMTLAYPANIEVIADYLCAADSSFKGLRNFDSSEVDKQAFGLAIKTLLVNQAPIYIYAYGIFKGFPEDKLKPLVERMLANANQRFQAQPFQPITEQQAMPLISIESLQSTFSSKDSITQNFPGLLGGMLKDLFSQHADTTIMDDSCLQEISSYRFWKGIFDTCDTNTAFRLASGEFVFVRF